MNTLRRSRQITRFAAAFAVVLSGVLFGPVLGSPHLPSVSAATIDVLMNLGDVRQAIDGFGASDAWSDNATPGFSDSEMDLFFSTQNGIGLSFLRLAIQPDGSNSTSLWIAQRAAARGARVWAAPWTAPAAWKDNNSRMYGGHLCATSGQGSCDGSHVADWAATLSGFASNLKANGIDLYGVSVQNEPDAAAPYDSMQYTNQEMVSFVKAIGPRLAQLSPRPKLLVGDFADWGNIWNLASAIQSDPVAASYTDIYAVHQYAGHTFYQGQLSRPLWQTEMSDFNSFDPSVDNAITVADWINDALLNGNANSWHYWWLRGLNEDNEGLVGHASNVYAMTKRLYAMGNYSRFVRPGWVRLGTSGNAANMTTLAFRNPSSNDIAFVVVNHGGTSTATFGVSGTFQSAVTPYQTYDDGSGNFSLGSHGNLEPRAAISAAGSNAFTATVPHGITTFVGTASAGQVATPPGSFNKSAPANGATGQSTGLTLSWGASSGATTYEYCIDATNDGVCSSWISTGASTSAFVSGLTQGTTYNWHVRASNNGGTTYAIGGSGAFWTFTTQVSQPVAPPVVSTGFAVRGSSPETTVTGTVNPMGGVTSAWFDYGTSSAYGLSVSVSSAPGSGTAPVSVSATLSGLSCGTTYHFRIVASNSSGTVTGTDATFVACDGASSRGGVKGDVDGDLKADASVYRASTGDWLLLKSADGSRSSYPWGLAGDVPVPGDYDGDGKMDLAIYRPSTGGWWIAWSHSAFQTYNGYAWGMASDVPVPADYDGDGKTDIAVYRRSTGGWWILTSGSGFRSYASHAWGLPEDLPVPADYDGDGKVDPAIYRPSTGGWWILKSSSTYVSYSGVAWGLPGDVPVQGDYDGDGRTDLAIFRPSTGGWWIAFSHANYTTYAGHPWGYNTDVPVPADYDGDGKTDIAVFRPATGEWWILTSSSNFSTHSRLVNGGPSDSPLTLADPPTTP